MDSFDQLKRAIEPLGRRLRSMLMRATVSGVDDTGDLQQLQVTRLEGETWDECERVGEYGFTSSPPIGAEAIVIQIGGNSDHMVILGVDDLSRPHPLDSGQTVLYDGANSRVFLDAAGNVVITASGRVQIAASTLLVQANSTRFMGDVQIDGDLTVGRNVQIGGTLNGHAP